MSYRSFLIVLAAACSCPAADRIVQFRNGLSIRGSIVELTSIDQNAFQAAGDTAVEAKPIWMIDDGYRRFYVNQRGMVVPPANIAPADADQVILLDQRTPDAGGRGINAVGSILYIEPFDEFGRRVFSMQGPKGRLNVHQGITEINPRYVTVEGLLSTRSYVWDMRMATAAFPSKKLYEIFANWLDMSILDNRLKVIRFFIQDRRYAAAREVLEQTIELFPEVDGLQRQLRTLNQQAAIQILDEALVRREAGQPAFALQMLSGFPTENVAIETRLKVQDTIKEVQAEADLAKTLVGRLRDHVAQLDEQRRALVVDLVDEMQRDLKSETLGRLDDFQRLGDDQDLPLENRISLAIGGWLLGSGSGETNLAVAISLIEVRRLVLEYLTELDALKRAQILNALSNQEGATPENVAKIIRTMRPPLPLPDEFADPDVPGLYRIVMPARGDVEERSYLIQLPPEYDPLRDYPCVVTLHRPGRTMHEQIDWWCGTFNESFGRRMGQAARQGFVVVAPEWQNAGLSGYRFTQREHFRVLGAVRDALRRTSIDPDRVFLSGHSAGGSAAWDISLAHPDLWAGVVLISADPDKHIRHYSENGKHVPQYFVMGEMAGHPAPLIRNGAVLERYLKPGYDSMLVSFRGRGEEDFLEQIEDICKWMQLRSHRRPKPPQRIDAATMRQGDQFFWWLELADLKPTVDVSSFLWEHADRLRPGEVRAQVTANGDVQILSIPSNGCRVLLAPEMGVRLNEPVKISWRSTSKRVTFDSSLDVMLEDVRTRGDRQQFYWMVVDLP